MEICRTIDELRTWRRRVTGAIGLVPTMGALHDGHLELIRQARRRCDAVGVSIFVNPRQFADGDDFSCYPRTLERDLSMLEDQLVDAVFLPGPCEMYPTDALTTIHLSDVTERLEGIARPGHFDGVCLVVCKLLNLFQPSSAYFGEKDYQQLVVVSRMVRDLNMPVEIVPVPTVRDDDGLAISSRNVFLTDEQRSAARCIPEALFAAAAMYERGERRADHLRAVVRQRIGSESLLKLEYVSLADAWNLIELDSVDRPAVLTLAAQCGDTRLIDNVQLDPKTHG